MLRKTNIKTQLQKTRSKRIQEVNILKEVQDIFNTNDTERAKIKKTLAQGGNGSINCFDLEHLHTNNIYHINDIEKICITYRLRFLDSSYFKQTIPEEAVSKIRALEKTHNTQLKGFQIVAPAKLMKLKSADDPLLFAPMGNDYYYLVHKWGKDLHPLRRMLMWPYKSFENLLFTIFAVSIALTLITPLHLFSLGSPTQEHIMYFLFVFKGVAGAVLYYSFSKGKNFNGAVWTSKYYN